MNIGGTVSYPPSLLSSRTILLFARSAYTSTRGCIKICSVVISTQGAENSVQFVTSPCMKVRIHAKCIKSTALVQLLLRLQPLALTPTDCCVTSRGDPIRGAVRPHTQYPVIDYRVVDLLNSSYTLPRGVDSVEPNVILVLQSVVMDIEFPNSRGDFLRGTCEIPTGCSRIPCCVGGRTAGKLRLLLDRNDGSGFWCCGRW